MDLKNVFVTVGTTKFDKLIKAITSQIALQALKEKHCQNLKIQFGAGEILPNFNHNEISLEHFRFKESLIDDIIEADLVISHAGAGTCVEVLELGKPLITVINEDLMHNHQIELAEKLSSEGYSFKCDCDTLVNVLTSSDFNHLKSFTYDNDKRCALFIESFLHSGKVR